MIISRRTWFLFFGLSSLSLAIWLYLSYPQLAFLNLSVNREKALSIAKGYLRTKGAVAENYQTSIVFGMDSGPNRYLQKTIKFDGLKKFIKEHDFDLFYWIIRFFKEHV